LFWIVIFGGVIFYIKLFDASLGMQVAHWFASAPVAVQDLSGVQSTVMSGVSALQTTDQHMQDILDAIANKMGIVLVASGDMIQENALTGTLLSGASSATLPAAKAKSSSIDSVKPSSTK